MKILVEPSQLLWQKICYLSDGRVLLDVSFVEDLFRNGSFNPDFTFLGGLTVSISLSDSCQEELLGSSRLLFFDTNFFDSL